MSDDTNSRIGGSGLLTGLYMLPITIAGLVAFLEKGATVAAVESAFGVGLFTTAIVESLWVVGLIVLSILAVVGLLSALLLVGGLIRWSVPSVVLGLLGVLVYALGAIVATVLFPSLPLLVGFVLSVNILGWTALVLVFAVGGAITSAIL